MGSPHQISIKIKYIVHMYIYMSVFYIDIYIYTPNKNIWKHCKKLVKLVKFINNNLKHCKKLVKLVKFMKNSWKHCKKLVKLVKFMKNSLKHCKKLVKLVFPRISTMSVQRLGRSVNGFPEILGKTSLTSFLQCFKLFFHKFDQFDQFFIEF